MKNVARRGLLALIVLAALHLGWSPTSRVTAWPGIPTASAQEAAAPPAPVAAPQPEPPPLPAGGGFDILPERAKRALQNPLVVAGVTLFLLPIVWFFARKAREQQWKGGLGFKLLSWLGWVIEWVMPGRGKGGLPLAPPGPVEGDDIIGRGR